MIHRDEHIGTVTSSLQQIAVLDPRSADTLYGLHVVARELGNQVVWNLLVKQDAHW